METKRLKNGESFTINIQENPYLYIQEIKLLFNEEEDLLSSLDDKLIFSENGKNGSHKYNELILGSYRKSVFSSKTVWSKSINREIQHLGLDDLSISYESNQKTEIEILYDRIKLIDINKPRMSFSNFINERGNSKILFSAPFGQGKTTFLKYFFEENKKEYEVFHLFPVNYSVAQNEDIFQYIKVELLQILFQKDIELETHDFNKLLTLQEFILSSPEKLINALLPILNFIPKIGGSVYKTAKGIQKFINEFNKYNKQVTKGDKVVGNEFLEEYYKKEGSIFENNFYTQLIRKYIEKIGKKTVLIIDDLDRMDPEHIFRVLNVFAAHFDSEYKDEEGTNKFGFDKIIIVCDYSNLKNIFRHKYGPNTSFEGYIDKFSSKGKFDFVNSDAVIEMFGKLEIDERSNIKFKDNKCFYTIVYDLVRTDNISLRELIKLQNENFSVLKGEYNKNISPKNQISQKSDLHHATSFINFDLIKTLHYLNKLTDIDSLEEKFAMCKSSFVRDINGDYWSTYKDIFIDFLPLLVIENGTSSKGKKHIFSTGKSVSFTIDITKKDYVEIIEVNKTNLVFYDKNNREMNNQRITITEFYEAVIDVIKVYKDLRGLFGNDR